VIRQRCQCILALLVTGSNASVPAQDADPEQRIRQRLNISANERALLDQGKAIVREVATNDRAEILIHGAVYVNGSPSTFLKAYTEVEKLVDGKGFLAAKKFGSPPTLNELSKLTFDYEDLQALRTCSPGDCDIQLPARSMEAFRSTVDWRSPDAAERANALVRQLALSGLEAYLKGGNAALGVYQDKSEPTRVDSVFRTVVSRLTELPAYDREFYDYLIAYPQRKRPLNTSDFFYWETVKFGLKPTFRINHVIVRQPPDKPDRWLVANKQLYASHYFQTALDMWFCVPATASGKPGFYLLTVKGSRQDGLTGFKGRLLRGPVISRTLTSVQAALELLKRRTEAAR
jgi:hypothetical protein